MTEDQNRTRSIFSNPWQRQQVSFTIGNGPAELVHEHARHVDDAVGSPVESERAQDSPCVALVFKQRCWCRRNAAKLMVDRKHLNGPCAMETHFSE